jgi:hypothetical protein
VTDASSSWWQTLPGILTAAAGAITAVGGLQLTLNQLGLIGNRTGPAAPPPTDTQPAVAGQSAAGEDAGTAAGDRAAAAPRPGGAQYSVEFTGVTEAKVRSHRADGVYQVLKATVENRGSSTLILTVLVRLTNVGRSDIAFSTEYFRLISDGMASAPTSSLIDAVDAQSTKQAEIVFELPDTARSLELLIDNSEDSARLPLVLKKSG